MARCQKLLEDDSTCNQELENDECPVHGSEWRKSYNTVSTDSGNDRNTNRKRGEDRNQSFGGETHQKQPKGGGNQRSRYS